MYICVCTYVFKGRQAAARVDSNSRPADPQSATLITRPLRHICRD